MNTRSHSSQLVAVSRLHLTAVDQVPNKFTVSCKDEKENNFTQTMGRLVHQGTGEHELWKRQHQLPLRNSKRGKCIHRAPVSGLRVIYGPIL